MGGHIVCVKGLSVSPITDSEEFVLHTLFSQLQLLLGATYAAWATAADHDAAAEPAFRQPGARSGKTVQV